MSNSVQFFFSPIVNRKGSPKRKIYLDTLFLTVHRGSFHRGYLFKVYNIRIILLEGEENGTSILSFFSPELPFTNLLFQTIIFLFILVKSVLVLIQLKVGNIFYVKTLELLRLAKKKERVHTGEIHKLNGLRVSLIS